MRKQKLVLILTLLFLSQNIFAQSGWVLQGAQREKDLYCTFFVNENTGWAAEESGRIKLTTNGGINWVTRAIDTANESNYARSIYFVSALKGFAIVTYGSQGKIYKTTDGGNVWTINTGPSNFYNKIIFTDALTGYVCGSGIVMKTTNGGDNWTSQTIANDNYYALSFINNNTGWVTSAFNKLFKTTNGGNDWLLVPGGYTINEVKNLKFINENTGFVYGLRGMPTTYGVVARTTNGGINWTDQSISSSGYYGNFAFLNEMTGYLVTGLENIYKTTNSGMNWSPYGFDPNTFFTDLSVVNNSKAFAVGRNGVIAKTDDGISWSFVHNNGYVNATLKVMQFINSSTGFIVGGASGAGYLFKTTNSGNNWIKFPLGVATFNSARCVKFINENTGFITGYNGQDFFIRTTNGGINWTNADAGFVVKNVFFINSLTGYASGSVLKKTTDGGNTWILEANAENENIFYLEESNGWGFSNNGLIRPINKFSGGFNYTTISTISTNIIHSVFFNNQTTGWLSVYDGLMKSTNGGINWSISYGGVYYTSFQFINVNTGWAASISLFGAPMVKTTNSGVSWSDFNISYPNVTNVLCMYFINEQTGWICADNVGILKTTTGGVSVMQISTVIPEKISLHQNYPNPFNPSTKINYELRNSGFVSLKVFDLLGREVAQLVNEKQNAGSYAVDFNSTEFNLPSGIYFYTLNAGEFKETRKMVLVK